MGDPQFAADPRMVERLNAANGVLDRFEDPSWLSWAQPAGLMPATQARVRRQLEERERRQRAAAEAKQLAADRRRDEEARKKREAGKKTTGGSSKPGRAVVARKGSKASGLGEDVSDSGSAGTAEHRARQTKSEVTKREANEAWEEMKKGRAPAGYILVSAIFLFSTITDGYNRRTTAIDARSHPGSWDAIVGQTTSSAPSVSTITGLVCLPMRRGRSKHRPATPHPFVNDAERGLSSSPAKSRPAVRTVRSVFFNLN
jgi:hypothetical protein